MASKRQVWNEYKNELYPISLYVGVTNNIDDVVSTFAYAGGSEIEDLSRYCLAVTIDAMKRTLKNGV